MSQIHTLRRGVRRYALNDYPAVGIPPDFTTNLVYKWPGNGATTEVWDSNAGTAQGSLTYDTGLSGLSAFKGDGSTSYVSTATSISAPATYSLSAWFKTTAVVGFPICGFNGTQLAVNATHDRMLGVDSTGKAFFGANSGQYATSSSAYNDGVWRHLVATSQSGSSLIYINGVQVGSVANGGGSAYSGYWQIGLAYMTNWSRGSSNYFGSGDIQDMRVYSAYLTSGNVSLLYSNGPRS
jgi:large repetitive protein